MAGMINQLIDVMSEQTERYTELLGLAKEKQDVIIQNDIETLQKLTNLENMVISQNNRLEKKRMALVNDISEVLGHGGSEIDLATLLSLLDGQEEQAKLKDVGERIRSVLNELKEVNDVNNSLIQNSLDYIEYSLNVIRSSITPNQPGFPAASTKSQENFGTFDAKK